MYSILIVGPGYTGSRIARSFRDRHQKVSVLLRNRDEFDAWEQEGIRPIFADLHRPETLHSISPAHFMILSVAPEERNDGAYRSVYLDGVKNFLNAVRSLPKPSLIVYLSSTGVYGKSCEGILDEDSEPKPDTERAKILWEAEDQILKSGFPVLIFRLAGIYGPERNRMHLFESNAWPEARAEKVMNMIHVEDVVGAIPFLFNRGREGNIYLGVDDEPIKERVFYDWLSGRLGKSYPRASFQDAPGSGRRLSNQKLKSLGFQFKYPNFRDGYKDFLPDLCYDQRPQRKEMESL